MGILISWLILSLGVWVAAKIVPGIQLNGFSGAVVVAAIFGLLNLLLGKILFAIIGVGTLGIGFLLGFLTRWVVNAILLKLSDWLTDRITVRGFGAAFLGALVISAVGTVGGFLVR